MSVEKRYADFFIFQKGGSLVALWIENNDIRHRKEWPIRRAGGSKTIYFRQQAKKNCKVSHARRLPCGGQWDERVRLYPFGICKRMPHLRRLFWPKRRPLLQVRFPDLCLLRRRKAWTSPKAAQTFIPSERFFTNVTIGTKWWSTTSKNMFFPTNIALAKTFFIF